MHSWGPEVVPVGTGAGDSWIHVSLVNQGGPIKVLRRNTASAVSITNAVSKTTAPFAAVFSTLTFFSIFLLFLL